MSQQRRLALFEQHAEFARRVARRQYFRRTAPDLELGELYQLAYTGLLEAIDRFDESRGAPFEGFAVRRIRGAILDGIAKHSEVRGQLAHSARLRRERAKSLSADLDTADGPPTTTLDTLSEIAVGLAIGFMLEGSGLYVAKDQAAAPPNPYQSPAWPRLIERLSAEVIALPERQRLIVQQHYVSGLDFGQIAELCGLSKGRISQLHKEALTTLRLHLDKHRTSLTRET